MGAVIEERYSRGKEKERERCWESVEREGERGKDLEPRKCLLCCGLN